MLYCRGVPVTPTRDALPDGVCEIVASPETADLTWLTLQAATALGSAFDAVAREHGLVDLRDWLVLTLTGDGKLRTQLEIASQLKIDKSTMVLILDRLQRDELIVRTTSAADRRVKIPESTPRGRAVQAAVDAARNRSVDAMLGDTTPHDRELLRSTLWRIAMTATPATASTPRVS